MNLEEKKELGTCDCGTECNCKPGECTCGGDCGCDEKCDCGCHPTESTEEEVE